MATLNIPNTFTNATIANANEVNGNFSAVKTFVEGSLVQADGSVKAGTAAINDGAITTAKIADSAVTEGKIATDAVTAAKMADASVALNTATVTGTLPLANGGTNATTALGPFPGTHDG